MDGRLFTNELSRNTKNKRTCVQILNISRRHTNLKKHKRKKKNTGVIHIMYTKEHVYKFLIHRIAIQHSTYTRRKKENAAYLIHVMHSTE